MDAENKRTCCRTTEAVEDRHESEHDGAVVERHGILVAGELQEDGPGKQEPSLAEVCIWQFEHVNHVREKLACRGNPILSGDAKKKQQVGNIKAPGTS